MDLRLVIPALGIWCGAALGYVLTGFNAGVVERHERAGQALVLGGLAVVLGLVVAFLGRHHPGYLVSAIGLTAIAGGVIAAAVNVSAHTASPLSDWITDKSKVVVAGIITTEPDNKTTSAGAVWKTPVVQHFTLASTFIASQSINVPVFIEVPISIEVSPTDVVPAVGTAVIVEGKLGESFRYGNFAAALNGVEQIRSTAPPGFVDSLANSMRTGLQESLEGIDPNSGSLVAGLAIGDESALPAELEANMRTSGLAHLTAVSGGNVAIVLALVIGLCVALRIQLRGRVVISLMALAFYVVLVQPQPSVMRAATMGAIVVLALLVGGRRAGPSILSTAIIILILLDPSLAISWGFALSVSATAGIIMLTPLLLEWAQRTRGVQRFPPVVIAAAMLTIAAQIATLPVLIAMGVPLSLGSVPANVLAMPMVPFITVGGLASAVVAPVSLHLGHALAWVSSWPAAWITGLANYFAQWPTITGTQVLAVILVGGLSVFAMRKMRRSNVRPALFVIPIALVAILVSRVNTPGSWVPDNWFMAMCDVGQGDAFVFKDESGKVIVVDVGPTPEPVNTCLDELNVPAVAAIIVSHFHRDHVGGIAGVFQGRNVDSVYITPHREPIDQFDYAESVIPPSVSVVEMKAGQVWELGQSRLQILWPERILQSGSVPNNASIVLLLHIQGLRILLTGDIEREAQEAIMRSHPEIQADIVKVPHHGSSNLDPNFADWAGGKIALFSVGSDNDYGHPSVESLREWGFAQRYRTDQQGSVAIYFDPGGDLMVSAEN